jgi:hypothetical protein
MSTELITVESENLKRDAKIREELIHSDACEIAVDGGCKQCEKVRFLISIHARFCTREECDIPNCEALRPREPSNNSLFKDSSAGKLAGHTLGMAKEGTSIARDVVKELSKDNLKGVFKESTELGKEKYKEVKERGIKDLVKETHGLFVTEVKKVMNKN